MYKFHQISTNDFEPISYDRKYLFDLYDKIINFLNLNIGNDAGFILAKPIKSTGSIDWYSAYNSLVDINQLDVQKKEWALLQYWLLREKVDKLIQKLKSSRELDNNNWVNIITHVFNESDNKIFSNGSNIVVLWGWKFSNNSIYKPNIISKPLSDSNPNIVNTPENEKPIIDSQPIQEESPNTNDLRTESVTSEVSNSIHYSNFWEFLRWFASKYWWLLWILLAIIILLLIYWGFVNNRYINELNIRQGKLEHVIDTICK